MEEAIKYSPLLDIITGKVMTSEDRGISLQICLTISDMMSFRGLQYGIAAIY